MPATDDGAAIDVHSHFLPVAWLQEVGRRSDVFGVEVREQDGRYSLRRPNSDAGPAGVFAKLHDEPARLEALQAMGISQQLVAPPTPALLYDLDREPARAVARLYNETVADACAASGGRLLPAATLPMGWPDLAVQELIHAAAQLRVKAVYLSTTIDDAPLDDERFDGVFRAAAEAGLPLLLHPTGDSGCRHVEQDYLHNIIGNPLETAVAAARLVNRGVLDRYPELRIILVHGGGVFPYLIGRMQHGHERIPDARASAAPPRSYLRRFTYDTIVHDARALGYLAETVGEDRLVIGTDYPYGMGDDRPLEMLQHAGLADPAAVRHGNARRLLDL